MYRSSQDYENIAKTVIGIYLDYGISSFPIDEKELCSKMGVKLLAYSDFPEDVNNISDDAFYLPPIRKEGSNKISEPIILYNDKISSRGRIRFSIFHEIKHFVYGETDESDLDEDMANYFAKYIMCPIPILIYRNIDDIGSIMNDFMVSYEASYNVLKNLENRRKKYGNVIFDYEKPLIELIEGGGAIWE